MTSPRQRMIRIGRGLNQLAITAKASFVSYLLAKVPRLTCAPFGILEASVFSAYLAAFTACCMLLVSSLFRKANLAHEEGSKGGQGGKLLR